MIEIISNPDTDLWRDFVYDHPRGNIFQTPEMADVFWNTKNHTPLTLAAVDTGSGVIHAMMNAIITRQFSGLLAPFTSRSIVFGGPLYADSPAGLEAAGLLLKHYDAICGKRAIYTEIRNFWASNNTIFPPGYQYQDHLNFLIDLSAGKEKLWEKLTKARRYGINKSRKMGVTVEEIKSAGELESLYYLLEDTYQKVRIPLADKSLFDSVYDHLVSKKMSKIFFAQYSERQVGVIVLLLYKQTMYDWYSASLKKCSKLYPGDLLVWHSLEWGAANAFSLFDFMGAGKPDEKYGVREFKRQFGGELVNYGRYSKIHSPVKYRIARKGLSVYQQVGNHVRFRH